MKHLLTMAVIGLMLAAVSTSVLAGGKGRGKGPKGPKGPGDGICNNVAMKAQDDVQEYRGGRGKGPGDGTGPICGCGEFLDEDGDGVCDICDGDCDGDGDGPKRDRDGDGDGDGPKGPRRGRR